MGNMSAADMFVPLGSEHACPKFKNSKNNAFGKLAGGAIMTASVMLATQLEAKEQDAQNDSEAEDNSAYQSASLQTQQTAGSNDSHLNLNVDSVLGNLGEVQASSIPVQIASLGATQLHTSPASSEFVSESGIPFGLEVEAPQVTDPSQQTKSFPLDLDESSNGAKQAIINSAGGAGVGAAKNGIDGEDGKDGVDGLNGENGTNGIAGLDGSNGKDGANGTNGVDGEDGLDGIDGRDGLSILILDREMLEQAGLLQILEEAGIQGVDGPFDTVILTLTIEQMDDLIEIFNQLASQQPEAEHGDPTGFIQLEGTEFDDLLEGNERDNLISGLEGDDILIGGLGADTLRGGEGNDTASYRNSTDGVDIDLALGIASGGEAQGDEFESIENIDGSDLMDRLIGNEEDNTLNGFADSDLLLGGEGSDTLSGGADGDFIDGGEGSDTATYFTSDAGVAISLTNDTASGGHAQGDELDNIENLDGTLYNDVLQGDHNNNRLGGHHGEDILIGEAGNDTLLGGNLGDLINGGEGVDTADYTASTEGVYVNLFLDETAGGEAEGDTLISIENLAGSAHDDWLVGDNTDNRLTGRNGDDMLIGNAGNDRLIGGEGADHLDGGAGNQDAADYSNASRAVGVDLEDMGFDGEADGDTYDSIEFVVGSQFDDEIYGDTAANRLDGGNGHDYLDGWDGDDTLIGGEGDDILAGGDGEDVFIFEANNGDDTIEDFEAGEGRSDRIWLQDQGFSDFISLQSAIAETDDGAYITLDTGSILLEGVSSHELAADDFILA